MKCRNGQRQAVPLCHPAGQRLIVPGSRSWSRCWYWSARPSSQSGLPGCRHGRSVHHRSAAGYSTDSGRSGRPRAPRSVLKEILPNGPWLVLHKLLRGRAVHTRRAAVGPDTPQRPAQILRREQPLPQRDLQAGDDSLLAARRPAATLSCGNQRNSPSPPGSWPASAGWLRSPRPARATPIPPSHLTFGPSRPLT